MIQLDEAKQKLTRIESLAVQAASALGLESLQKELDKLRTRMEQPGFWDNVKAANKVNKKIKPIEDKLNQFEKISGRISDAAVMLELIEDEYDDESAIELVSELVALEKDTTNLASLMDSEASSSTTAFSSSEADFFLEDESSSASRPSSG